MSQRRRRCVNIIRSTINKDIYVHLPSQRVTQLPVSRLPGAT